MPSFVTHYLFAKEFSSSNVTLLGSQGPDPFFYYGIVKFYRPNIKKFMLLVHFFIRLDYLKLSHICLNI